jgi:hypothetical protein
LPPSRRHATPARPAPATRYSRRELWLVERVRNAYELVSLPILTVFLFHNRRFDPAYGLTWRRKFRLALQFHRTTRHVQTGTSNRAHMAMAAKIFEIPAHVEGVLVEAGCWKGGTTANLSLVAAIVGRDLIVYDSFQGMPPAAAGDRWADPLHEGSYRGELEEVRANVAAYGDVSRCQFRKGWFSDTLGDHTEPVVTAFVDVDHQASMHQCVLGLWPHLTDQGYFFIDEYVRLDYCALFFSERFWRTYFDRPPPGLMGTGTGVAVGQYFVGPYRERPPVQEPRSLGWTRKDFYAEWDYRADDEPASPLDGGTGAAHGPEGWTMTATEASVHAAGRIADLFERDEDARRRYQERLATDPEAQQRMEALWQSPEGQRRVAEALARDDAARARFEAHLAAGTDADDSPAEADGDGDDGADTAGEDPPPA